MRIPWRGDTDGAGTAGAGPAQHLLLLTPTLLTKDTQGWCHPPSCPHGLVAHRNSLGGWGVVDSVLTPQEGCNL